MWLRENVKQDGTTYYKYHVVYVDDILSISKKPEDTMKAISELYRLKDNSVAKPTRYLGAEVIEYFLPDDKYKSRWGLSSNQYVSEAIRTVELKLAKIGKALSNSVCTPLSSNSRLELDVSPLLDSTRATYYQNLIAILRWIVELGRIDMYMSPCFLLSLHPQEKVISLKHFIYSPTLRDIENLQWCLTIPFLTLMNPFSNRIIVMLKRNSL